MIDANVAIEDWAACVVDADGTVRRARGCAVVKTNTGIYTVTLDKGITDAETVADLRLRGPTANTNITPYLLHVSDTVKEVDTLNASVGADMGFSLVVRKLL